jgi:hypothetical protein
MASEIKVDTIVNAGGDNDTGIDLATNDQILLKVANSTKLTMNSTGQTTIVGEGGSTTTSMQQGLAKAWTSVYHNSGTPTTKDSMNIASYVDQGTGHIFVNVTNPLSNTGYSVPCGGWAVSSWSGTVDTGSAPSSTSQWYFYHIEANSAADVTTNEPMMGTLHGDLA